MSLQLKDVKKNIKGFQIEHKKLCFKDEKELIHVEGIPLSLPMNDVFYLNKKWLFQDLHHVYLLNSDKSFRRIASNKGINGVDKTHHKLLLSYEMSLNAHHNIVGKQVLFDLKTLQIMPQTERAFEMESHFLWNTTLYGHSQKRFITAIDLLTQNILWKFDLYNIGISNELGSFITVREHTLWLLLKGGILLGIDIQTGQVQHTLQTVIRMTAGQEDYPNWHLPIQDTFNTVYDEKKHQLIGFSGWHYWEVDLQATQPQIKMWLLKDLFQKYKIDFNSTDRRCMDAHYIYFADSYRPRMAALNRKTLQFDWVEHFTDTLFHGMGTLMKMDVADRKLYVIDHKQTLYIFELNKNNKKPTTL